MKQKLSTKKDKLKCFCYFINNYLRFVNEPLLHIIGIPRLHEPIKVIQSYN